MRELRNTVAHDYPLNAEEFVSSLNELMRGRGVEELKAVYGRLKERVSI